MITPLRSRYQTVVAIANNLGIDMHRVPAKYYVLCNTTNECCKMFDDTPLGDDEAVAWMQEQSDSASLANIQRNMQGWSEPENERVDFSEDCP